MQELQQLGLKQTRAVVWKTRTHHTRKEPEAIEFTNMHGEENDQMFSPTSIQVLFFLNQVVLVDYHNSLSPT